MMLRRRRQKYGSNVSGFFHFQSGGAKAVSGFGDGDFVRLRDEYGNEWRGTAEKHADNTIRYRFRDSQGRFITGIGEGYGVTLRDEDGHVWRGFVDS